MPRHLVERAFCAPACAGMAADGRAVDYCDGFVNGDTDTPVTETVDGESRLINDCRVRDHLSFTLPADLPPGLYDMQVVGPNITSIAALGERILSNSEAIEVMPPPTARFQITLETLVCRKETSLRGPARTRWGCAC